MQEHRTARPALMGVPKGYRPWQYAEAIGERRGKAEGTAEFHAQLRQALLTVLATCGLTVSAVAQAAIAQCTDAAQFSRWLVAAATATDCAQVFGDCG